MRCCRGAVLRQLYGEPNPVQPGVASLQTSVRRDNLQSSTSARLADRACPRCQSSAGALVSRRRTAALDSRRHTTTSALVIRYRDAPTAAAAAAATQDEHVR